MKRFLPFLIIAVVLAAAGLIAWYLKRSAFEAPAATPAPIASPKVSSASPGRAGEPVADPPRVIGEAKAQVTLEEFGDFQCPPCAALHPVLKKMEHEFGPKLRVIFREFPLVPTHEHAM